MQVPDNAPGWNGGNKFLIDAGVLPDDGHTNNVRANYSMDLVGDLLPAMFAVLPFGGAYQ
jgi:hypothetical protein